MVDKSEPGQFSPEETEQRVRATLRGAFKGPPTQLKAIPKKFGKSQPPRSRPKANRRPDSIR